MRNTYIFALFLQKFQVINVIQLKEINKMELLQSQAPAERELLGNSADRTLDIGV